MCSYHSLAAPKGKFICFDSIVVEQRLHKHGHTYKQACGDGSGEHADRRACLLDNMSTGVYAFSVPQQGKTSPLDRPAAWPRGTQAPSTSS